KRRRCWHVSAPGAAPWRMPRRRQASWNRSPAMDGTPTSHGSTELVSLRQRVALLEVGIRRRGCMLGITGGALLALGLVSAFGGVDARRQLASCRARVVESGAAPH